MLCAIDDQTPNGRPTTSMTSDMTSDIMFMSLALGYDAGESPAVLQDSSWHHVMRGHAFCLW